MDLGLAADHLKCRICLSPDATADFIQLNGSKAEMFEEVVGVELTIDGVKSESVICPHCFKELQHFHNFKAKGVRAEREHFKIQRQLAAAPQKSKEPEQAQDAVEPDDGQVIEPYSQSRVKQEPPVEFVLILPRPMNDQVEDEEGNDDSRKWVKSVTLTKFDAKWSNESRPFQMFLTCQQCQLVVKNQGHFTQHLRTCSKLNRARFECDICGKGAQKKWLMSQHMLKHSSERNFRCTKCEIGFKSKNQLMKHKKTHDKSIACSDCQNTFSFHKSLKLHQMQHRHGIYATAPEENFDCSKCDRSFTNPHYLKQHQMKVHDENEVKCEVCGQICKNRASLLHHIRTHSKVECLICRKFVPKNLIRRHVRSHGSHFECDICNHSTFTKGGLKKHIERKHLLKKLIKDSKREDFGNFELLEKLQLKYPNSRPAASAEKKFKCDKCAKAFGTQNNLKDHKRWVHPEKLFECQVCKMAFKVKRTLNRHETSVHAKMSEK